MTSVVQRVTSAAVTIEGEIVGRIDAGLCVLAAIVEEDTEADLLWTANKLIALRVFPDGGQAYHLSVADTGGGLLLVSNFTVAASTATGRRPGFDRAMKPDTARPMFERFVALVRDLHPHVQTGRFGADMRVSIDNDGPLTLMLDSRPTERKRP